MINLERNAKLGQQKHREDLLGKNSCLYRKINENTVCNIRNKTKVIKIVQT